jgi:hypothetical protein
MSSGNESVTLVRDLMKKGLTATEAICKVIDHRDNLHWDDRNRLTEENKQIKARLARLEKDEA